MIIFDAGSESRCGQQKLEQYKYSYTKNTENENVSEQ
jgi:hypothetical protein